MDSFEIKKIIVPTDFSVLSENAIKTATAMCKRHRASMVLLNVVDAPANIAIPYGGMGYYSYTLKDMEEASAKKLKKMSKEIKDRTKISVETTTRTGNVSWAVRDTVQESLSDIIVMGTHGASGLREFFIGSNAYSVIKHSYVPVLTVPSEGDWTDFKRILFPVRMTNSAYDKYKSIRSIIAKNDSTLILLGLADNNNPSQLEQLSALMNDLKFKLAQDGITYEGELYHGNKFPEKILETAKNYDSDLIVITAELDHTIKDFFIGPYSQQIVNHSKIPVLTIRPQVEKVKEKSGESWSTSWHNYSAPVPAM